MTLAPLGAASAVQDAVDQVPVKTVLTRPVGDCFAIRKELPTNGLNSVLIYLHFKPFVQIGESF